MAEKEKIAAVPELTIEELAAKHKVKNWIMAGVMRAKNWAPGKRMPEEEFKAAVEGWLKSPMGG